MNLAQVENVAAALKIIDDQLWPPQAGYSRMTQAAIRVLHDNREAIVASLRRDYAEMVMRNSTPDSGGQ